MVSLVNSNFDDFLSLGDPSFFLT